MSLIKAIGIDLAKLIFSIHGVDEYGKTKLKQTVKRNKLLAKIAQYHLVLSAWKLAPLHTIGQGSLLNMVTMSVSWILSSLFPIAKVKKAKT